MRMGRRIRRAAGGLFAVLLSAAPALAAPVQFNVDTDVRLGYDMNPFLSGGSDLASGYVEVGVSPRLTKKTEKGEVTLRGHYDRTEYFRRYGSSDQYGAELSTNQRLSQKLTVYGALQYDSDVIGQGDTDDIISGIPIDDTDVNLIGLRRRSNTYRATGGWQYQATPKDVISADAGYTDTRYGSGPPGADSKTISGRIAWKHAISERTKVGISASAYRIDYDTPGLKTWIMEPAVTFSTELSSTWHFDAQLGVSFSRVYVPAPLLDSRSTGLSGNASLCHRGVKDDFCFYAGRSVTGSGAGGSVVRTQFGVNYNRRLTETLSWSGAASYSRSKSQTALIGTREYVSASGGFDWRVKPWLTLGTEARYRDVFGAGRQIRADFGGEVNATVSLPKRK